MFLIICLMSHLKTYITCWNGKGNKALEKKKFAVMFWSHSGFLANNIQSLIREKVIENDCVSTLHLRQLIIVVFKWDIILFCILWLQHSFCQKTECYAQAGSYPLEEAHKSQVSCNTTCHQAGWKFFARKCQSDHYFRKHAFLQVSQLISTSLFFFLFMRLVKF